MESYVKVVFDELTTLSGDIKKFAETLRKKADEVKNQATEKTANWVGDGKEAFLKALEETVYPQLQKTFPGMLEDMGDALNQCIEGLKTINSEG